MVNPDSDLYRAHPDWVYHFANRARTEKRNQLVLNLARQDVADWTYQTNADTGTVHPGSTLVFDGIELPGAEKYGYGSALIRLKRVG